MCADQEIRAGQVARLLARDPDGSTDGRVSIFCEETKEADENAVSEAVVAFGIE